MGSGFDLGRFSFSAVSITASMFPFFLLKIVDSVAHSIGCSKGLSQLLRVHILDQLRNCGLAANDVPLTHPRVLRYGFAFAYITAFSHHF